MDQFIVIGQRVQRIDAQEIVTGEAKYITDIAFPDFIENGGVTHGKRLA